MTHNRLRSLEIIFILSFFHYFLVYLSYLILRLEPPELFPSRLGIISIDKCIPLFDKPTVLTFAYFFVFPDTNRRFHKQKRVKFGRLVNESDVGAPDAAVAPSHPHEPLLKGGGGGGGGGLR